MALLAFRALRARVTFLCWPTSPQERRRTAKPAPKGRWAGCPSSRKDDQRKGPSRSCRCRGKGSAVCVAGVGCAYAQRPLASEPHVGCAFAHRTRFPSKAATATTKATTTATAQQELRGLERSARTGCHLFGPPPRRGGLGWGAFPGPFFLVTSSLGQQRRSDPRAAPAECEQGHRVAISDYASVAWVMAGVSATESTSNRFAG
jgi:hypothetical protein